MKIINFKTGALSLILLGLIFSTISCNDDETQTVTTKSNLVMEDDFDVDGTPNSKIWSFETGRGEIMNYNTTPIDLKTLLFKMVI